MHWSGQEVAPEPLSPGHSWKRVLRGRVGAEASPEGLGRGLAEECRSTREAALLEAAQARGPGQGPFLGPHSFPWRMEAQTSADNWVMPGVPRSFALQVFTVHSFLWGWEPESCSGALPTWPGRANLRTTSSCVCIQDSEVHRALAVCLGIELLDLGLEVPQFTL